MSFYDNLMRKTGLDRKSPVQVPTNLKTKLTDKTGVTKEAAQRLTEAEQTIADANESLEAQNIADRVFGISPLAPLRSGSEPAGTPVVAEDKRSISDKYNDLVNALEDKGAIMGYTSEQDVNTVQRTGLSAAAEMRSRAMQFPVIAGKYADGGSADDGTANAVESEANTLIRNLPGAKQAYASGQQAREDRYAAEYADLYRRYAEGDPTVGAEDFKKLGTMASDIDAGRQNMVSDAHNAFKSEIDKLSSAPKISASVTTERGELPARYDRKSLESDKEEYANYSNGVFADWLAGKATDEQLRAVGEREKELTARTNAYFATEAGAADAAEELEKQLEELETRKKELTEQIAAAEKGKGGLLEFADSANNPHGAFSRSYAGDGGSGTDTEKLADLKTELNSTEAILNKLKEAAAYNDVQRYYYKYLEEYKDAVAAGYEPDTNEENRRIEYVRYAATRPQHSNDIDLEASVVGGHATEDQKHLFYYIENVHGKEAALDFAKKIQPITDIAYAEHVRELYSDAGLGSRMLVGALFSANAGLNQFASGVKGVGKALTGDTTYEFPTGSEIAYQAVRDEMGTAGRVASDIIMTAVNMAPSIVIGQGAGLVAGTVGGVVGGAVSGAEAARYASAAARLLSFGGSAGGNAYNQAINEGHSYAQSLGYGLLVGASEAMLQEAIGGISGFGKSGIARLAGTETGKLVSSRLANLLRLDKLSTGAKMIIGELGKMAASNTSEGVEEALQEILDVPFRRYVLGDKDTKLDSDKIGDAVYAGLLGFLTAGIMNLPGNINALTGDVSLARILNGNGSVSDINTVLSNPDAIGVFEKILHDGGLDYSFAENSIELNALLLDIFNSGIRSGNMRSARENTVEGDFQDVTPSPDGAGTESLPEFQEPVAPEPLQLENTEREEQYQSAAQTMEPITNTGDQKAGLDRLETTADVQTTEQTVEPGSVNPDGWPAGITETVNSDNQEPEESVKAESQEVAESDEVSDSGAAASQNAGETHFADTTNNTVTTDNDPVAADPAVPDGITNSQETYSVNEIAEMAAQLPETDVYIKDKDGKQVFAQSYVYDISDTKNWKNAEFDTLTNISTVSRLKSAGVVKGGYGVAKRKQAPGYSVTHLQSGFSVGTESSQAKSKALAEYIIQNFEYPRIVLSGLEGTHPVVSDSFKQELLRILKEKPYLKAEAVFPPQNKTQLAAYLTQSVGKTLLKDGAPVKIASASKDGNFQYISSDGSKVRASLKGAKIVYTDTGFEIHYKTGYVSNFGYVLESDAQSTEHPAENTVDAAKEVENTAGSPENTVDAAKEVEDKQPENSSDTGSDIHVAELPVPADTDAAALADFVLKSLNDGQKITQKMLFAEAERLYSLSGRVPTPSDIYNSLELGVNRYVLSMPDTSVSSLTSLLDMLPTQNIRTEATDKFQQFSTPPTIGFLAATAASVNADDVVLEPSAGTGSLAVFAARAGATVYVNEIDPARLAVLENLPFDAFYMEDAGHIGDILADKLPVRPTAVIMNPPFSSSGTTGIRSRMVAANHIEQALTLLADGGRLVAVVGRGMSDSAASFGEWWRGIKNKYKVVANVGIDGRNYSKYGTDFGVRILVIDKVAPDGTKIIQSEGRDLGEIYKIMEGIGNGRLRTERNVGKGQGVLPEVRRGQHEGVQGEARSTEGSEHQGRKGGERNAVRETRPEADPGTSPVVHIQAGDGLSDVGSGGDAGRKTGELGTSVSSGASDGQTGSVTGGRASRGLSDDIRDESVSARGSRVLSGDNGVPGKPSRGKERGSNGASNDRGAVGLPRGNISRSGELQPGRDIITADENKQTTTTENTRSDTVDSQNITRADITDTNQHAKSRKIKKELTDSVFEEYKPAALPFAGAKKHPAKVSESAAMSAVKSPDITYVPNLPKNLVTSGALSNIQLESICLAGQSHEQKLEDGSRRGFFIGDGAGIGKGRTIAGIIYDNYRQGRKKAIWVTRNDNLASDSERDIKAIFGSTDKLFAFEGGKKADRLLSKNTEGVVFLTYGRMSKSFRNPGSNLEKIVSWLGKDFDGVIVFDEAHTMSNVGDKKGSRGKTPASQAALAGLELQSKLPNARIVYSSATGASDISGLGYAVRLGLWGSGTAFSSRSDFISKISKGGLAAMEVIARDLKAMGLYVSRGISYDGVEYSRLDVKVSEQNRKNYELCSIIWQNVFNDIEKAIDVTHSGNKGGSRANAMGAFWSSQQRFYNQLLSSFEVWPLINDMERELAAGHSCVIQLTSTNEAETDRELERTANDPDKTLEDFDVSPRDILKQFLEKSFPVDLHEEFIDENGVLSSRPVKDSKGNNVITKEAVAIRESLLQRVAEMNIPSSPLDDIINHFGAEMVAENTGRTKRVLTGADGEKFVELRSKASRDADVEAFQNGDKRIMIFSEAGGTGKSYHADRAAKNAQLRIHYVFQAGWKADAAVQGLARTNRSNQVQPPVYKLVTTDISGQKRFISTIARRMDSMGAITKGQRQAGSSGIFSASDNLENAVSSEVLSRLYRDLVLNQVEGIEDGPSYIEKLGLKNTLIDKNGGVKEKADSLTNVPQFLNRLLILDIDEQNQLFDVFDRRLADATEKAALEGTLDRGLENYKAESVDIVDVKVINKDDKTGAETLFYSLKAKHKVNPIEFSSIDTSSSKRFAGFVQSKNTGAVKALYRTATQNSASGFRDRFRVLSVNGSISYEDADTIQRTHSVIKDTNEAERLWNEELKRLPSFTETPLYLIGGAMLPVWNRLTDANPRVMRVLTSDGDTLIGRMYSARAIAAVLRNFDVDFEENSVNIDEDGAYNALLAGKSIEFPDGSIIKAVRIQSVNRLEFKASYTSMINSAEAARNVGLIPERIDYKARYFLPRDSADSVKTALHSVIKAIGRPHVISADTGKQYSVIPDKPATNKKVPRSQSEEWKTSKDEDSGEAGFVSVRPIGSIVNDIRARFDIPIRTGNYHHGGKAAGVYNTRTESIRTAVSNDLPTIAHELGHHLDAQYGFTESGSHRDLVVPLVRQYPEELRSLYPKNKWPAEAFAEFVRDYLTNRSGAVDKYGKTDDSSNGLSIVDLFESILSEKDLDSLKTLAGDINAYLSADNLNKARASIVQPKERARRERSKLSETLRKLKDRVMTFVYDDMYPLEMFERANDIGVGSSDKSAYQRMMLSRKASEQAYYIVKEGMVDMSGNPLEGDKGKSYIDILEPVMNRIDDFDTYLVLKHAIELFKEKGEGFSVFADPTLNTTESCKKSLATLEEKNPDFAAVSEEIYGYIDALNMYWGVASGVESPVLYEYLHRIYPHYVPLNRVVSTRRPAGAAKSGGVNHSSTMRRIKGSGLEIFSPTTQLIYRTEQIVKVARRNQAGLALASLADSLDGLGGEIERVTPDMLAQIFPMLERKNDLIEAIMEKGDLVTDIDSFTETLDRVFDDEFIKFLPYRKDSKGIVTVRKSGKNVYYQIGNPELYRAITAGGGENSADLYRFMRVLGALQVPIKFFSVGVSVPFILSNMIRDFATAYTRSNTVSPITYTAQYLSAALKMLQMSPEYRKYLALGGGHGSRISKGTLGLRADIRELIRKDRLPDAQRRILELLRPLKMIAKISDFIETVPRFTEFSDVYSRTADEIYAMRAASMITTDFDRRGTGHPAINNLFVFGNAAVQGQYDHFNQYRKSEPGRRRRVLIKKAMWLIVQSAAMAALLKFVFDEEDEEDYFNLSTYKKNNNWVIPIGDGRFITIPKPREEAVVTSLAERAVEYAFGNKESFYDFGGYVLDTLMPPFMPSDFSSPGAVVQSVATNTSFGKISDVMVNMDYKGDEIVPGYMEFLYDKTPELQYTGSTTKLSKAIGDFTGLSPMKLDYLLFGSFGWIGTVASDLMPVDDQRRSFNLGLSSRFIADSRYSTDVFDIVYNRAESADAQVDREQKRNGAASAGALYEKEDANHAKCIVTHCNRAINELDGEQKQRDMRALLQGLMNAWSTESTPGADYAMELYGLTGDERLFYNYDGLIKSSYTLGGYTVSLTPEQFLSMVNDVESAIEDERLAASHGYDLINESAQSVADVLVKNMNARTRAIRQQYAEDYGVAKTD